MCIWTLLHLEALFFVRCRLFVQLDFSTIDTLMISDPVEYEGEGIQAIEV